MNTPADPLAFWEGHAVDADAKAADVDLSSHDRTVFAAFANYFRARAAVAAGVALDVEADAIIAGTNWADRPVSS